MSKRPARRAAATAAAFVLAWPAAHAADLPSAQPPSAIPLLASAPWSPWMIRVRAVGVLPDASARLRAGGTPLSGGSVTVTDSAIPELDITYFFTRNIAAEVVLGVTRHSAQGVGTLAGSRIGSTWILPPTVTLQYHVTGLGALKPYVGVGATYAIFFDEKARGGFTDFRLSNAFGPALQVGLDYMLGEHWGLNLDLKKVFLEPKVKLNNGVIRGRVTLDPWLVGAGVTYRF